MRKSIVILIVFIIFFIVNLVFFNFSDNYKFFIKKLKFSDQTVYIDDKKLSDEIIEVKKSTWAINKVLVNTWKTFSNTDDVKKLNSSNTGEVLLWEQYNQILDKFKTYELWKLEILSDEKLFDLTDEYPDKYYEYYSKDLTLYLFTTKSYNGVLDIFKLVSSMNGSIFTVNEANNIWDKSFFLNLKWEEKNPQVRIVFSINGLVFWLKFDKKEYNKVKDILSK